MAGQISQRWDDVNDSGTDVLPRGRDAAVRRCVPQIRLGVQDQEDGLRVVVGVAALPVLSHTVATLTTCSGRKKDT